MRFEIFQRHLRRLMADNEIEFELEHRAHEGNRPKHTKLVLSSSIEDCKTKNVKIVFKAQGKAK